VSLNDSFAHESEPTDAVALAIVEHPRVIGSGGGDTPFVGAVRDELLVLRSARRRLPALDQRLRQIADYGGNLAGAAARESGEPDDGQAPEGEDLTPADAEIWRLTGRDTTSFSVTAELADLVGEREFLTSVETRDGKIIEVPAVSPNHICVVCPSNNWCPAGPPHSTPVPPVQTLENFVEREDPNRKHAHVVVIDTGYLYTEPPHDRLDDRVHSVPGEWYDTHALPPRWRLDPPDELDANGDGMLDGIAGHGTFVAGLVAHTCRQARITVVGQRHEFVSLGDIASPAVQAKLFTTEFSLAHSMLAHCDADVIQCGFAFPTLSNYPSIPFSSVLAFLAGPGAPRDGVAVVCPAGNESSSAPYWPAAHPDAIGVAALDIMSRARAWFSNWGGWVDCCTRGQYVLSTYIHWYGPVQGEPPTDLEDFRGWARWDGTSFASPVVAGRIAAELLAREDLTTPPMTPVQVWGELAAEAIAAGQTISAGGVTKPHVWGH
jgi:subtilisin family serine protease